LRLTCLSRYADIAVMMRFETLFGSSTALVLGLLSFTACSSTANVAAPPTTTVPASAGCGSAPLNSFPFAVYADAAHQQEQCQFSVASNATAYVLMQNVATSGNYVMFVQWAGANSFCTYLAPPGHSALPPHTGGNSALCNVTRRNVSGVSAPGGDVSFSWVIKPSLKPGLYTVGIYDQNANGGVGAVLATIQVTLTP
jgi:hypothetical protein